MKLKKILIAIMYILMAVIYYTKKVVKQTMVYTTLNYAINNSIEHTISSNNIQEPMIELFPSPFWQSEY